MAGNSWSQPVAGEPSWGSPHTHVETLVNNFDPSSTGNYTVTCSTVPTGTTGIYGFCYVKSATGSGRIIYIKDMSGNVWAQTLNPSTSDGGYISFMVPIDSSKQFQYSVSNADVNIVYIYQCVYYC